MLFNISTNLVVPRDVDIRILFTAILSTSGLSEDGIIDDDGGFIVDDSGGSILPDNVAVNIKTLSGDYIVTKTGARIKIK